MDLISIDVTICCFNEKLKIKMRYLVCFLIAAMIGWAGCTADAEAHVNEHADVDRPGKNNSFYLFTKFEMLANPLNLLILTINSIQFQIKSHF